MKQGVFVCAVLVVAIWGVWLIQSAQLQAARGHAEPVTASTAAECELVESALQHLIDTDYWQLSSNAREPAHAGPVFYLDDTSIQCNLSLEDTRFLLVSPEWYRANVSQPAEQIPRQQFLEAYEARENGIGPILHLASDWFGQPADTPAIHFLDDAHRVAVRLGIAGFVFTCEYVSVELERIGDNWLAVAINPDGPIC